MELSPRVLYPNWINHDWKYVDFPKERRPYLSILCLCDKHAVESMILKVDVWRNADDECDIYLGQCRRCGKINWTCSDTKWMRMLTDYQLLQTVLIEYRINYADSESIIGILETKVEFDGQGKLR
jgi:hypothetical protein